MSEPDPKPSVEVPLYCAGMILPTESSANQDATAIAHYLCLHCSKVQKIIESASQNAVPETDFHYESDWRTIEIPHHQTGLNLSQSVKNGCHLCSLLMDRLLENDDTSNESFVELSLDQRVKQALEEETKVELRLPIDPHVGWDHARLVIKSVSELKPRSMVIRLGPTIS
jgi:hypothetical protein